MSSPWIEAVRSVALNVPDLEKAEAFYTEVWRLSVAHRGEQAICLRGTGSDHHLLALLTHVVLNSHAVDDTQRFLTEALGFTLAGSFGSGPRGESRVPPARGTASATACSASRLRARSVTWRICGTGSDHHLLALHAGGPVPRRQIACSLRCATLRRQTSV